MIINTKVSQMVEKITLFFASWQKASSRLADIVSKEASAAIELVDVDEDEVRRG